MAAYAVLMQQVDDVDRYCNKYLPGVRAINDPATSRSRSRRCIETSSVVGETLRP